MDFWPLLGNFSNVDIELYKEKAYELKGRLDFIVVI